VIRNLAWFVAVLVAAPVAAQEVASAQGAVLRGLDKVSGVTTDIEIRSGASTEFGRLTITLGDCRYPVGDPSSNAFAEMSIADRASGNTLFSGWMIAASPALSALDNPRYDVWVLRCMTS
jgi:hypothetical protein